MAGSCAAGRFPLFSRHNEGRIAQLVRAFDSHSKGPWFEPRCVHHVKNPRTRVFYVPRGFERSENLYGATRSMCAGFTWHGQIFPPTEKFYVTLSSMTVRNLLTHATIDRLDASILLGHILKKPRAWLLAHAETSVSPAQTKRFQILITRRRKHEPIAHLTGKKEFFSRAFIVNKHVLTPRPETELMVERARDLANGKTIIWDVGTGSGAIAVTLACERPTAKVLATDISAQALAITRRNATRHRALTRITFLNSNLLQPPVYRWLARHAKHRNLIICANLPYLPASDKKILAPDVTKYEPHVALFSGSNGLTLIQRFLGQLARHLPEWEYKTVTILLEFDPPQAKALMVLAKKLFPRARVTIHRDLAKRKRMMEISV